MWEMVKRGICREFRSTLEERAGSADYADMLAALPGSLRQHATTCRRCQSAAHSFLASRALLAALPVINDSPDASFASRVMAMIAAREQQLRQRMDSWAAAVPRLAARLTWATTAALLFASALLYEGQEAVPPPPAAALSANASTSDYLFDMPATPANGDEVLSTLLER